jgi:Toprim-like
MPTNNLIELKINHEKLYTDFRDKCTILDVYEYLGGDKNTLRALSNGEYSGFAIWRQEKHRSASYNPIKDLAFDHADNTGFNSYSLLKECLNDKQATYKTMCQMACLNIDDYYFNHTKIEKKVNPNLPKFRDLSQKNIDFIKLRRGIDYNSLTEEQKATIKEDEKGVICLLYIYKGEIEFYQRWLPDTENKYMSGKGMSPKATFNLGGLNSIKTGEDLWLVEGRFDEICMQLSGFNCVSTFNAKGGADEIATFINQNHKSFKNIYIALDNDKIGKEGTENIIKKLSNSTLKNGVYKAFLINNSEEKKQDANDFFRRGKIKKTHFVRALIEPRLDEETLEREGIKFYSITEKGGVIIDQRPLGLFLEYLGFRNLKIAPETYKVVRVVNNRYKYVDETEIMDIVESKVLQLPYGKSIFNKLFNGSNVYLRFNSSSIKYLKKITNEQDTDTLHTSKIYYRNGFLLVEKDQITLRDYSELDKPIFEEDIKNFDFDESYLENTKIGEFEKFASLTQNNNQDRILKLRSTLGYLCHRYNNPSHKKAVIFTDGHGEIDINSGGSGKSIMAKSIRYIRNLVIEDGKKFNSEERFAYQKMTPKTEILYIDDIRAKFVLEYLFSCITEGFTVEQKNKQAFTVIAKLLLSSNRPMKINYQDGSTIRRIIEVEFGDYFHGTLTINGLSKPEHTPLIEFGHNLFDEWSNEEWQLFYVYMAQNIQLYFNKGISTIQTEGIKRRRLQASINGDKKERPLLYEFFEEKLIVDKKPFKGIIKPKDLMESYFEYVQQHLENTSETIRQRGFTDKLKEYLNGKGLAYKQDKDMYGAYFIIL